MKKGEGESKGDAASNDFKNSTANGEKVFVFLSITKGLVLDSVSSVHLNVIREEFNWNIAPGSYLPDLLEEKEKDFFVSQLNRAFSEECFSFNVQLPYQNSEKKDYQIIVTPSQMGDGEISKIGLAIQYLEEQDQNLVELTSDSLLSIVFNSVSMGICITDPNGVFVEVDQEYCRIYGYEREELIGKNFTLVVPTDHREYLQKLHDDFFINGVEPPAELEVLAKDGRILTIGVFSDLLTTPNGKRYKVTSINDLTDLKSLEYQVETMSKNLPGIVMRYMLSPDGEEKLLYVSEGIRNYAGLNPDAALENIDSLWSQVYPEYIPGLKESIMRSAQTLQTWEFEWKYKHPEGMDRWHHAMGNPKKLADGTVVWDSIIIDITQEKEAKAALFESEQRFEKLISEGVEMISVLNAEGEYVYNSPSYQTMLGYSPKELKGFQAFSLIHPDDVLQLSLEFQQVFDTKKVAAQPYRIRRSDGTYIWLKSIGTNLLDDPSIQGIVVNSTNITDLIQIESDLKSSEQQYKYLFENNPGAMMIWELKSGRILDVNERACAMYGYSRAEFLEVNVYKMRPQEEEARIREQANNQKWTSTRGEKLYHGVSRHFTKAGEILSVEINAQMIDYHGQRVSLVLLNDVTEKVTSDKIDDLELVLMEEVIQGELFIKEQLVKFLSGMEEIIPRVKTSIHCIKDGRLYDLASPSLPTDFLEQIEGLEIGSSVIFWGSVVNSGQRLMTDDIATDPQWEVLRESSINQGLKSCYIQPIFNSERNVIATFAVYFLDQKTSDTVNFELYQRIGSLISLVIENYSQKEELNLSNERYEYVNLATKDAIYDWDILNDKLYRGISYARFLGSNFPEENQKLQNWEALVHPSDLNRVKEILENDLSNPEKERFKAEYQILKNDGTYAFVIDRAIIVRDDSKQPMRMVGVISDVTQQRMEEFRLKLLESVITNANDAVVITEAEPFSLPGPRIVYVNQAFTRMTGFTEEEVLGKSPRILQGPNTHLKELQRLRAAMDKWQPCEITTINYKKNGEEFWTNFSISPVADADGWYTHWISIQREVTAQKIEEQKRDLLAQIVQAFGEERRFKFALDRSLEKLVKFKGLDAGEIWLVNSDKSKLNIVSKFAHSDKGAGFFSKVNQKLSFRKGEGFPGHVWEKNETLIFDDLTKSKEFSRKSALTASGLYGVFGIPLQQNNEVIGVAVFMTQNKDGFIRSFLEVFSSISQVLGSEIYRKKVEDELSQIFDTAQDIICIMGFDGKFKKINKGAMYLLGYSEEELLSISFMDFVHPEDVIETENILDQLCQGRNFMHFFNRLITKEGEVVWLDWNSTVVLEEELVYSVAKDITEEKELQKLLDSANQMAKIGFWDVGIAEGKGDQYWSAITKEIFEVPADYTPDVSQGIAFYTAEAIPVISEYFNKCITTGESYDLELPAITQKGKEIWIRTIGQAEFRDGACIRVFGTIQDISDLKKAQIEQEKSFEQKIAILESIGDAFFSLDNEGLISYWNAEASRIFGGEKGDMFGKSIWNLSPFSTEQLMLENLRESFTKESSIRFEQFFSILDRWLEVSIYPSEIGLSVYLKDISIRKTTEELIRQSNERFEKVSQVTADAIWDWDFVKEKMYWGEGFRTLFGVDLDQVTPSIEYWASLIHPDDFERVEKDIQESISNPNVDKISNEYRLKKADGNYAYVVVRGKILRNEKGEAFRIIGAVSDFTKRKEFESSLRNLNEKLEVRARELATSNAELEQFAYVASHDLQEPLRMVSGFLTQLEMKYSEQLDDRAKKYINFAVDGAKRMRQIILDLLEFSRVGRIDEEPEFIDLNELVTEVCNLQSSLIAAKNAKIFYSGLPKITGFRTPMIQVFQNLIGNSIKYSKEGIPPEVTISHRELPEYWEFAIADNGIGIDSDSFDKIFIIFQRLHTRDQFAGSGIGLSIVKKIIENIGGKIWVESELGIGTTIYFTIKK